MGEVSKRTPNHPSADQSYPGESNTDLGFLRTGGAQNIKLKPKEPKEKKATEDGSSDKVKGKGGFRGFRGFM
jgi:hypothetical protein